jgi:hypothetical protein
MYVLIVVQLNPLNGEKDPMAQRRNDSLNMKYYVNNECFNNSLCNACGLRWSKKQKSEQQE